MLLSRLLIKLFPFPSPIIKHLFALTIKWPKAMLFLFLIHIFISKPLELLNLDIWGPTPILSIIGARYYISFLDDSTKFLWLFPLKLKFDALQIFKNLKLRLNVNLIQWAGATEKRHCQIVEVSLALLAYSHLPNIFWEDAFLMAIYIINRLPTLILQHKSPYDMANNS